jgi:hypothetical protein
MDLTGLSPEQINAISNTDISGSNTLVNAAGMLANQKLKQQENAINAAKLVPDLIEVEMNGKTWKVRRQDVPEAIKVGASIKQFEQTHENINLSGGASISGTASDLAAITNALTNQQKAPSEIRSNEALVGLRGSQSEEAQARSDLIDQQIQELQNKKEALRKLSGVPLEQYGAAENAGNVIQAAPSILAAQSNKLNLNDGKLTSEQVRKNIKDIVNIANILPEKVTDIDIDAQNQLAISANTSVMMTRDDKGKVIDVNLPVKDGKQITPKMVQETALKYNMTTQELLRRIAKSMEEK